jgi:hypothetical protein
MILPFVGNGPPAMALVAKAADAKPDTYKSCQRRSGEMRPRLTPRIGNTKTPLRRIGIFPIRPRAPFLNEKLSFVETKRKLLQGHIGGRKKRVNSTSGSKAYRRWPLGLQVVETRKRKFGEALRGISRCGQCTALCQRTSV